MKLKTWIFRCIAVSIPVLFFVGLEYGLRLVGYGKVTPLFIENPAAPHYLLPKPDVIQRYFSDKKFAPNVTIEPNFFLKQKPQDGIRIFVQGGSTAAGFPYGLGASLAGMLDYRLKQSFPTKTVEVVNTALSAVNSYTLLDFADEIIEQQPDAVLIYAGHNEYLGILGVGSNYTSTNSRGATLLFLKVKDLRTFQLLQSIYDSLFQPDINVDTQQSRTVMSKVAKHKNIEVNSHMFNRGIAQFEGNMQMLINKYADAGIPVLISTVASNLSDQPPFESKPVAVDQLTKGLGLNLDAQLEAELTAFLTQVEDVQQASTLANKLTPQAIEKLQAMVALDSAAAHFWLGHFYQSHGQHGAAKSHFELARQHDLLRFRAPNEINQAIKRLSQSTHAKLVDVEAAMAKVAPNGIIGHELMIEHLHPTAKGYFELSDAFYQAIKSSNILGPFEKDVSRLQAYREQPLLPAEEYWGAAKIAGLLADYPFVKRPQKVEYAPRKTIHDELGYAAFRKQIDWLGLARETQKIAHSHSDKNTYIKTTILIADAIPNDIDSNFQAGVTLIKAKRADEAIRFFNRVLLEDNRNINGLLALAHAYSELNQLEKTLDYLQQVLSIDPNNATALENLPALKAVLDRR